MLVIVIVLTVTLLIMHRVHRSTDDLLPVGCLHDTVRVPCCPTTVSITVTELTVASRIKQGRHLAFSTREATFYSDEVC